MCYIDNFIANIGKEVYFEPDKNVLRLGETRTITIWSAGKLSGGKIYLSDLKIKIDK